MKISCIIPTCDRLDFLAETIQSVFNQTLAPAEIIVVNNGKNKLVLPAAMSSRVKVFDIIPYAGVAQARNFGACLAAGDYLAFLDDDDMWAPEYLANVAKAVEEGAVCILSSQNKLEDGKITPYQNPEGKITIDNLLIFNPGAGGPNIVIAKDVFFRAGGYDPKLPPSEDKALILEILRAGIEVKVLPDNPVIVRIHGGARLTNYARISEGISQFTRKYRGLMTRKQYLFNLLKISKNQYKAGQRQAGIKYIFVKIIYSFFSVFAKK